MSEEQINIAIAEACGWTYEPEEFPKYPWLDEEGEGHRHVPDYCDDLNAMHKAEKTLDYSMLCDMENSVSFHFAIKPFHANAHQRAEAFLRTIGRWEEGKE